MTSLGQDKGDRVKVLHLSRSSTVKNLFMKLENISSVNLDIRIWMMKKDFFISQVKAVTATVSHSVPGGGGHRKYKQWLKEVEKYALMSGKPSL